MKKDCCLVFAITVVLLLVLGGCTKKGRALPVVAAKDLTLNSLATSMKTTSGKTVEAYEVDFSNKTAAVILVVGGGKLEKSTTCPLVLEGGALSLDFTSLQNQVVVVSKQHPPVFLAGVTPTEIKAKCVSGRIVDLPIDQALTTVSGR